MEVVSGVMDYRLGDRVFRAGPGEVAVVRAGAAHTWWNPGPGRLVVRVELQPALGFETFIETIYGLAREGRVNRNGVPKVLRAAVVFHAFRREWVLEFLPRPVSALLPVLARVGRAAGYRPWYPEFSSSEPVEACP